MHKEVEQQIDVSLFPPSSLSLSLSKSQLIKKMQEGGISKQNTEEI